MSRRVLALMLSGALAASGCGPETAGPAAPPTFACEEFCIDPTDRRNLETAFAAGTAFLRGIGVETTNVELTLLEGPEVFDCVADGERTTAAEADPLFCPVGEDGNSHVVVQAAYTEQSMTELIEAAASPDRQARVRQAAINFLINHELMHYRQFVQGDPEERTTVFWLITKEPQADCFAGEALEAIAPDQIDEVTLFLAQFPTRDFAHGTPEQRIAALQSGADGDCTMPTIRAILELPPQEL